MRGFLSFLSFLSFLKFFFLKIGFLKYGNTGTPAVPYSYYIYIYIYRRKGKKENHAHPIGDNYTPTRSNHAHPIGDNYTTWILGFLFLFFLIRVKKHFGSLLDAAIKAKLDNYKKNTTSATSSSFPPS
jgi:hypothetical protein